LKEKSRVGEGTPNAADAAEKVGYVLVMGVSGAGKSTIGKALADRIGAGFIEADDYHPAENIRLMSNGEPLSDAHRWPWLQTVAEAARRERQRQGRPVVIACSALKRSYRDVLRQALGPLSIVHLSGSVETIRARLEGRRGHFMPIELLGSQLAILQPPGADEEGGSLSIDDSEAGVLSKALRLLNAGHGGVGARGESGMARGDLHE
jgi:gluconokinase